VTALISHFNRRTLLIASIAVFAAANFLAAFSHTYWMLAAMGVSPDFRRFLYVGAFASASALVAPERRGRVPAIVNAGIIAAIVAEEFEGHRLTTVNAGHMDIEQSTCLHMPSIGLLVGGDVDYNGIHLYLGETDARSRRESIATLDHFEALRPDAVIAEHKKPENDDRLRIIDEIRHYLQALDELA
jgi:hypothetical protein